MPLSPKNLADVLVKQHILSEKDVESFLKSAEESSQSLSTVLGQHSITGQMIRDAIATQFQLSTVDLAGRTIDKNTVQLIPEVVSKQLGVVAFARDEKGLHVATDNPENVAALQKIQNKIGMPIQVYVADTDSIVSVLGSHHESQTEAFSDLLQPIIAAGDTIKRPEDMPIVQIVDRLLSLGYSNKASDIHIEPYIDETLIRFRIDGLLHDIARIPKNLHELVIMRIKILSRLRTDEHRAAQDGKLQFNVKDETVDVRVSIVPIVRGEKIVMRILSEHGQKVDLDHLGIREVDLKRIRKTMNQPWGMILVTGPTGSGKTTTLYTIIKELNSREVNISTIEDPVEYDMEGINQIQVNEKTNLTFAAGLRAIVRQDPDIIMVGEIRDSETAKIAINSAMTGHLVLSTLHTNDAATTLPRLLDMGIEPFLVASTVNLVIAQRLVRTLCGTCKKQTPITGLLHELVEQEFSTGLIEKFKLFDPATLVYRAGACDVCQQTGYKGRTGIYELLEIIEEYRPLILEKASSDALKEKAMADGMVSMIEDGILKIKEGVTSVEEVLRVIKE